MHGEVVRASKKDPKGWTAADKFTVVLESARFNPTELSAYFRERGLFPEVGSPLAAEGLYRGQRPSVPEALVAIANVVLTIAEQRDLEKRQQQHQKEIKQLKQDLRRKKN